MTRVTRRNTIDWLRLKWVAGLAVAALGCLGAYSAFAQPDLRTFQKPTSTKIQASDIQEVARRVTVRILSPRASGSGAIVRREGQTYTVLTNWHVVAFSNKQMILTPDGQQHPLLNPPRQLGDNDLAIVQFTSENAYEVARMSDVPLAVGESLLAAGFPMHPEGDTSILTLDRGLEVFRVSRGEVSLLPSKSFRQGYRLGYTNDITIGMSGGPIFNAEGLLVGINGRRKNGNPDFGIYRFADGTEPSPQMLEEMVRSSWGIPIQTYLELVSSEW